MRTVFLHVNCASSVNSGFSLRMFGEVAVIRQIPNDPDNRLVAFIDGVPEYGVGLNMDSAVGKLRDKLRVRITRIGLEQVRGEQRPSSALDCFTGWTLEELARHSSGN